MRTATFLLLIGRLSRWGWNFGGDTVNRRNEYRAECDEGANDTEPAQQGHGLTTAEPFVEQKGSANQSQQGEGQQAEEEFPRLGAESTECCRCNGNNSRA